MAIALKRPVASIVGVVFALGWPMLFLLIPSQRHQDLTNLPQDTVVIAAEWIAVVILACLVVFWERLALFASTGFRRLRRSDWIVVGVLVALSIAATIFAANPHAKLGTDLRAYAAIPFVFRLLLVLTAGICEEFCFRGYAIERLIALTGRRWIAAVAAIALFTLGHVGRYGFSQALIYVAIIAAVLTLLYLWRRNIWPCIALHWFIDGVQLVILASFAGHAAR
ncbi:MAG TPA: CPBP family intramembrane glutamic endopeptidase [Candidatus Baltobacteraceae bacterium]